MNLGVRVDLQKLLPNLDTDTNHGALPEARSKETQITDILGLFGDADSLPDFLELSHDSGTVHVAASMKMGQIEVAFFPSVMRCKPPRRLGEEEECPKENEPGDSLHSPCDTEGRRAFDVERATVGY